MRDPAPYPLMWPEQMPRPKSTIKSQFKTSLAGAIENVKAGIRLLLEAMGERDKTRIISSNASLGESRPADPGVAVWFKVQGEWRALPCARYHTPAENLQAIVHVVEARRTELRHVGVEMVRATFTGLLALPPPATTDWWEVLGVSKTAGRGEIEAAYKTKAKIAHPDRGGTADSMAALTAARDEALASFGP